MYKAQITYLFKGKEITFMTETNPLSNSQMWWFEGLIPMYSSTLREVKKIMKDIRTKFEVIKEEINE